MSMRLLLVLCLHQEQTRLNRHYLIGKPVLCVLLGAWGIWRRGATCQYAFQKRFREVSYGMEWRRDAAARGDGNTADDESDLQTATKSGSF